MDQLFQTAGITLFLTAVVSAVIWAVINELNSRYWQKQKTAVLIGTLACVLLGSLALTVFENPLRKAWQRTIGAWTPAEGDPVVVGIYPTDLFGPLHQSGLEAGLQDAGTTLDIVPLTATTNEMKTNSAAAKDLLARLRSTILRRKVVAVVGPPVTEFTGPVIETIKQTGKKPPVFITSAAPREPVGWTRASIPLFRINSGIDERAKEFAALAREAIGQGLPLTFLIEQKHNSNEKLYGELVWRAISDEWSADERRAWEDDGLLERRFYDRSNISVLTGGDLDQKLARPGIVMLLGLGGDYTALVKAFYKESDPPRMAMLGGWMNGFDVDRPFREGAYQWTRLFEITDLDLRPRPREERRFLHRFQTISPPVRDQAFSYDAGRLISLLFQQIWEQRGDRADVDKAFVAEMVRRIRAYRGQGVTGPIRFNQLGQNDAYRDAQHQLMAYAQYDGHSWRPLAGAAELIARARQSSPASSAAATGSRRVRR